MGSFTGKGDYVGADVYKEPTPKLSIGVTYDYNDRASKTRGQLGSYVEEDGHSSLETIFADMMFKYQGFSVMAEYVDRKVDKGPPFPILEGSRTLGNPTGDVGAFYSGKGINLQTGYIFENNIEVATRYTKLTPDFYNDNTQYTFALSKYISKHMLKVQSDFTIIKEITQPDVLMFRMQLEVGF